jgi:patatin-like phospholipase/acyl hydrolase
MELIFYIYTTLKRITMKKKICILSIDGGGIRGILPGVILTYVENKLREKQGDDVRLSDYFDLVAGTSTGGILTSMYLLPDEHGRPKFQAEDAVNLYLENGGEIFKAPFLRRVVNPFGLFESKYPAKNIEKILKKYFDDKKLSELLKPCIVTAYDFFKRETIFFNREDTKQGNFRDFYVRDITRATSAAPTYFPPAEIYSLYGDPLCLIDGGVFAGNPAMCAYAEARTSKFKDITGDENKINYPVADDMLIVSVGTGNENISYPYKKASRWGVAGWLRPLIDIFMSGNSETVHYQLRQMFDTVKQPGRKNYYRLSPGIGMAKSDLDDASAGNMRRLEEAGKTFVAEHAAELNEIVEQLIVNKASNEQN